MRNRVLLIAALLTTTIVEAHNGVTVGHSPLDPNAPGACPTSAALQLFLLDDPAVGGPINPGHTVAQEPGEPTLLARLALGALLARPEFGGFVYVDEQPGFHFVDAANACHAMTTDFTGGAPFEVLVLRTHWPASANMGITDSFGLALLLHDGEMYAFGSEAGAHFHPLWLARRAGAYDLGLQITSDFFSSSDDFSLSFATTPACAQPVPLPLANVFNADVVDSDASDLPTPFGVTGGAWLLDGHLGSTRGLPVGGQLDVFQLGGANGAGLLGSGFNCLLDDGVHSSAATVNLLAGGAAGRFESLEVLLGAAGNFTSNDKLTLTLNYESGAPQTVTVRRAASNPKFFPLLDWHIGGSPTALAVGRSGGAVGGGFERSNGSAIDTTVSPIDGHYFQRVTFPADPSRVLHSVAIADYSGAGRVGVFAVTGMRGVAACANESACGGADISPVCGDCRVDDADLGVLLNNFGLSGGATKAQGDLQGDGQVNDTDLGLLLNSFGVVCD